jgi:raw score 11.14|nr:MAG TPA: Protein of unknown function (DUF2570) [Caudoviricetes sp.]
MFNFLTTKERWILLVGPVMLVLIILFQSWQANHWYAEMVKEEQLKAKWQNAYVALNESVQQFTEQQAALTQAIQSLKTEQTQQAEELKNALAKNKKWADGVIPDDVARLLNKNRVPQTKDTLPKSR